MPKNRAESVAAIAFMLVLAQTTAVTGQEVSNPPPATPVTATPVVGLPEITPGKPMTFAEAVAAADKHNRTLASARLEIEKTRAQLKQAMGLVLPMIQAGMQYMHNDHEDTLDFAESMAPLLDTFGISPDTMGDTSYVIRRQEMMNGSIQARVALIEPKSWLEIKTAKKGVELAASSVEAARQQLLFGTAKAYFFALMSRTLIGLHKDQIQSASEHLTTAQERLNAGVGIRIDVIRAETDLEQARQRLKSSLIAFDNARDTLGHLTGVGGLPMPVSPGKVSAPTKSDDDLVADAVQQRADLKAKGIAVELAEKQLSGAWMQFLPTMDAAWQLQYQFTEPPDMGSDDRSRWAAVLSLTVPLYNHFRYGDLDYKRAALRQAEVNAEDAKSAAALEIRKSRRSYMDALSNVTIAEKQSALAEEALVLVEESYSAGTGSSLEVTDARRTASAAGVNLAAQQLKVGLALLDLLQAVGEDISEMPR